MRIAQSLWGLIWARCCIAAAEEPRWLWPMHAIASFSLPAGGAQKGSALKAWPRSGWNTSNNEADSLHSLKTWRNQNQTHLLLEHGYALVVCPAERLLRLLKVFREFQGVTATHAWQREENVDFSLINLGSKGCSVAIWRPHIQFIICWFGVILFAQPQKFDVPLTARKTPE